MFDDFEVVEFDLEEDFFDDGLDEKDEELIDKLDAEVSQVVEVADDTPFEIVEETMELDMTKSTNCEFEIETKTFINFLSKISLNNLVDVCYIIIKDGKLFSAFTEPNTTALQGFITETNVDIKKEGTLIIAGVSKYIKVLKLYSGKISVEYSNKQVFIRSDKKKTTLFTYDEGYISSLLSINLNKIDIDNLVIDNHDLKTVSSVGIDKKDLQEILDAYNSLGGETYVTISVNPKQVSMIKVSMTNYQDTIESIVPIQNLTNCNSSIDITCGLVGFDKVLKYIDKVCKLYVSNDYIALQGDGFIYFFAAVEPMSF